MSYRNKFVILLTGVMLGAATLAQAAPVKNLRTSVSPARVRIVLDSEEPVQYKAAKNGLQLVVSLSASTATAQQAKLKDTLVKTARVAPDGRKASKLLIDLSKDAQYKVYQLANPHRLVVDIYRISISQAEQGAGEGRDLYLFAG